MVRLSDALDVSLDALLGRDLDRYRRSDGAMDAMRLCLNQIVQLSSAAVSADKEAKKRSGLSAVEFCGDAEKDTDSDTEREEGEDLCLRLTGADGEVVLSASYTVEDRSLDRYQVLITCLCEVLAELVTPGRPPLGETGRNTDRDDVVRETLRLFVELAGSRKMVGYVSRIGKK